MNPINNPEILDALSTQLKKEQRTLLIRRILHNRNVMIGSIFALLIIALALLGPLIITRLPNEMQVVNRLMPPSWDNLFGTDEFGRDLLARVIHGARVSLFVGISVSFIASALGLIIGLYAGTYNILDHVFMRICDGLIAIPGILLAIALMAALGSSLWNVVIALSVVYTPSIARTARASVLQVKQQAFVEALRIQGASSFRILWLNIVPNILSPILVQTTYVLASAILSEAALSFLGVGIIPPDASWGNILQASKLVINKAWWMVFFPGVLIIVTVLSFNLLGDGLRDLLDPKTKRTLRRKHQRKGKKHGKTLTGNT